MELVDDIFIADVAVGDEACGAEGLVDLGGDIAAMSAVGVVGLEEDDGFIGEEVFIINFEADVIEGLVIFVRGGKAAVGCEGRAEDEFGVAGLGFDIDVEIGIFVAEEANSVVDGAEVELVGGGGIFKHN